MSPADWLLVSSWIRAQRRPAEIEAAVQRIDEALEPDPIKQPEQDASIWPRNVETK